jgi:MFS-type transporter involved in bile tolerance (Atg22 family)
MGWVTLVSGNPRTGILSILVLFFAGMIVFRKVNETGLDQHG